MAVLLQGPNVVTPETWSNISATPAKFVLRGGRYGFQVTASWGGGTVGISRLSMDGSTYIPVAAAFSSDSFAVYDLPWGTYKLVIATASAVYADLTPIVVGQ